MLRAALLLAVIVNLSAAAFVSPYTANRVTKPTFFASQGCDPDDLSDHIRQRSEKIRLEQERQRLETANTKSFLKRRPVKLPYEDSRRWVQANLGADTQAEFEDMVANGNLRTPYIPKNPEQYYTATKEWISWDHFLKGCFDDKKPSGIRPPTGAFD